MVSIVRSSVVSFPILIKILVFSLWNAFACMRTTNHVYLQMTKIIEETFALRSEESWIDVGGTGTFQRWYMPCKKQTKQLKIDVGLNWCCVCVLQSGTIYECLYQCDDGFWWWQFFSVDLLRSSVTKTVAKILFYFWLGFFACFIQIEVRLAV